MPKKIWTEDGLFRFDPAAAYAWRLYDDITVATVAFNRLDCTQKLVESCLRHIRLPFRLLVVDNGSEDGTGEYLAALKDQVSNVEIVANRSNVGLPRALLQIRDAIDDGVLLYFDNDLEILSNYAAVHVLKAYQALKLGLGHDDVALGLRLINAEEYGFRHAIRHELFPIPAEHGALPRSSYATNVAGGVDGESVAEEVVIGWTDHLLGGSLICPVRLFKRVRYEDCFPKYIGGTDSFTTSEFVRLGVRMGYIENGPVARHNDWPYSAEKAELYERLLQQRATVDRHYLKWKLRSLLSRRG